MTSLGYMAKVAARLLLIPLLIITAVIGCGTLPGAAMSSRTFNLTGFSLPVAMAYSTAPAAQAQAVGISTSADAVRALVMRAVMQAVLDVLEQQGRLALLPDAIISAILNQLSVTTNYQPLECKDVVVNHAMPARAIMATKDMEAKCIIFGNTITATCSDMRVGCTLSTGMNVMPIPSTAMSISGTLSTTNVIMANWSRDMWQTVVNRVVRAMASGALGLHFISAVATVS